MAGELRRETISDIGVEERRESMGRLFPIQVGSPNMGTPPQTEWVMVDVLESGDDTGGGPLDIQEKLAKKRKIKSDRVLEIPPQSKSPQKVWTQAITVLC